MTPLRQGDQSGLPVANHRCCNCILFGSLVAALRRGAAYRRPLSRRWQLMCHLPFLFMNTHASSSSHSDSTLIKSETYGSCYLRMLSSRYVQFVRMHQDADRRDRSRASALSCTPRLTRDVPGCAAAMQNRREDVARLTRSVVPPVALGRSALPPAPPSVLAGPRRCLVVSFSRARGRVDAFCSHALACAAPRC